MNNLTVSLCFGLTLCISGTDKIVQFHKCIYCRDIVHKEEKECKMKVEEGKQTSSKDFSKKEISMVLSQSAKNVLFKIVRFWRKLVDI